MLSFAFETDKQALEKIESHDFKTTIRKKVFEYVNEGIGFENGMDIFPTEATILHCFDIDTDESYISLDGYEKLNTTYAQQVQSRLRELILEAFNKCNLEVTLKLSFSDIELIKLALNERAKSNEKILKDNSTLGIKVEEDSVLSQYLNEVWEIDALYRKISEL